MGAKPSVPKIPPVSSWGGSISKALDPNKNGVASAFKGVGNAIAAPFMPIIAPFIPPRPPPPPPPPWYPDSLPPEILPPAPPVGLTPDQSNTFTKYLNNYLKSINDNINKEFTSANTILSDLVNINLAEITDLTSKVDAQNKQIDKQTRDNYNKTNKVTNIRTQYGAAEIEKIKSQNYFLFIIYYIIVIIFSIILFFMKPDTIYLNITIIILMLVYPFFIYQIENFLLFIIYWFYSLITGNILTSNIYLTHSIDN